MKRQTYYFAIFISVIFIMLSITACTSSSMRKSLGDNSYNWRDYFNYGVYNDAIQEQISRTIENEQQIISIYFYHDGTKLIRDRSVLADGSLLVVDSKIVAADYSPFQLETIREYLYPNAAVRFDMLSEIVVSYAVNIDSLSRADATTSVLHLSRGFAAEGATGAYDFSHFNERLIRSTLRVEGREAYLPDVVVLETNIRLFDSRYACGDCDYIFNPFGHVHDPNVSTEHSGEDVNP